MAFRPSDFQREERGRRRYDSFCASEPIETSVGSLRLRLLCRMGEDHEPILAAADRIASWAREHGEQIRTLILAHHRLAEEQGWLEFWGVPAGLPDREVLHRVPSIELQVSTFGDPRDAICVTPDWEPEHQIVMHFRDGIEKVNGKPFEVDAGGVLRWA